jgi:hypothetical protein
VPKDFKKLLVILAFVAIIPIFMSTGCNSTRVPYGDVAKVVGRPLDHAQVASLEKKLVGRSVQTAITELGTPIDIFRDAGSSRQWFVFSTERNTLGKCRYIIGVNHDRVLTISKVERGGVNELDIPRRHVLRDKVMGKRPQECRKELRLGSPLLTVSSEKTRRSAEFYDARVAKGSQIYFCLVRYNPTQYCEGLDFITVAVTTNHEHQQ